MYKSYYFLNRYIIELRQILINKTISEIFSQEKDKLLFNLENGESEYLEINVSSTEPYILLKKKFSRAKKNTKDFFPFLIGSKISDVSIASDDRIVRILTSGGDIYFSIRGNITNVFIIQKNQIIAFKKEDEDKLELLKNEFLTKHYISSFNMLDERIIKSKSNDQIKKDFPFIGKDIWNEIKLRSDDKSEISVLINKILHVIKDGKPAVFYDESSFEVKIGFDELKIFSGLKKEYHDNILSAFDDFISKRYYFSDFKLKKSRIESHLIKELKKVTSKLNNLNAVIDKGSNEELLNKFANLLLINLNSIKPSTDSIQLKDIYDDDKLLTIKLDPKLNANQNIKHYFDKARGDNINLEKSVRLKDETQKYFKKLKSFEKKSDIATSIKELNEIMDELNIKENGSDKEKNDIGSKFKHYLIENKYDVYVGKDSANNDLLTTKFAKQNDFWFHARSVSGSHVVLRVQNTKEAIPKNVLKKAASLAAYHSKAKTSGLAPVTFTLKKYVVKRKGMPVGQVALLKEEVLLVKPEIPKDCEFIT